MYRPRLMLLLLSESKHNIQVAGIERDWGRQWPRCAICDPLYAPASGNHHIPPGGCVLVGLECCYMYFFIHFTQFCLSVKVLIVVSYLLIYNMA